MLKQHKHFQLPGIFPQLKDNNTTYLNRMKTVAIVQRMEFIVTLLNFIAEYPPLYKSYEFINFLEISRISNQTLQQNIENIKTFNVIAPLPITPPPPPPPSPSPLPSSSPLPSLQLPMSPSSYSQLTIQSIKNIDIIKKKIEKNEQMKTVNVKSIVPVVVSSIDSIQNTASGITTNISLNNINTMKQTIQISNHIENDKHLNLNDYIFDAALKFSEALRAEVNMNYADAFQLYKYGIDILIGGSRFDVQDERKRMAKDKLQKYMRKAQQIYDNHILIKSGGGYGNNSNSSINDNILRSSNLLTTKTSIERPINQLARFKVIKILENVMQVQDVTNKKVYIMKAIDKPSPSNKPNLINLPKNVPFMVSLIAFYNSETKVYLLMHQASGGKLQSYINTFSELNNHAPQTITSNTSYTVNNQHNLKNCDNLIQNSTNLSMSNKLSNNDYLLNNQSLLSTWTTTINSRCIPLRSIKRWASEIATAIMHLHSMDIICMDLHMNNILLGSNAEILLSYFYRQECTQQYSQKLLNLNAIELLYVAPERPLSYKSDWWSFGIILFELLTGYSFVSCHPGGVTYNFEIQYSDIDLDDESKDLLQGLLQIDPELRYDQSTIQNHEFFRSINWNEMYEKNINRDTEFIYFTSS